ncbi:MAG: aminotransferase class V-fold PLP-dependent enzyme [Chloroflexota bacterium]
MSLTAVATTPARPPDDARFAALRAREFARLDERDQAYLDHTGGGLHAESQVVEHQALLRDQVLGNPHSINPTSALSTELAAAARRDILSFLRASADEYVVVFTPNASGACKLVADAYPFAPGDRFLLAADDHNSVNGIRVPAQARGAEVRYLPLRPDDLRLDDERAGMRSGGCRRDGGACSPSPRSPTTRASVTRWHGSRRRMRTAGTSCSMPPAFLPTARLDLSRWRGPRRGVLVQGLRLSHRHRLGWWSDASCWNGWSDHGSRAAPSAWRPWPWCRHTLAPDEVGFEDGTIDYLGIPAVSIGLRFVEGIGIEAIGERVPAAMPTSCCVGCGRSGTMTGRP